ncbi:MAG: hypothetical protein GY772_31150, partial [bacterium]|nr:hypothetical protein [bacterium]
MNGARCEELLVSVFKRWSDDEANHGAVAIQEQPGKRAFLDYNRAKVLGDDRLAQITDASMPYATLGSGHINQVLRNILASARAPSAVDAVDPEGRLQLSFVAAHDSALAEACRRGLRWEILSYRLAEEEEDGVICIQAALNDFAKVQMLEHEMQSIRHLATVCASEQSLNREVRVDSIRARLAAGGSALADTASFLPLLHFVLEQGGAGAAGYVDSLVAFHERFVNPKSRRLRAGHFQAVCALNAPLLRGALLKAAYGCKVTLLRDGWIEYFGVNDVAQLAHGNRQGLATVALQLLHRFHVTYPQAGAFKDMSQGDVTLFLGRLDMEVG